MGRNGINSGLRQGWLQGVKTSGGLSKMKSGFRKGMVSEPGMHDKIQDPTILQGGKRPTIFFTADYVTAGVAGSSITAVSQLIEGSTALNVGSSPAYQPPYSGNAGVYNNKAYIDFNSIGDSIYTSSTTMGLGKNEFTLMLVFRISSALANRTLFCSVDSTSILSTGDIVVDTISGTKVRVTFTGADISGGGKSSSVYETYEPTLGLLSNWHLLTVKVRLYQPNGPGSEMEIWLNGKMNMVPVTTTFVGSTNTFLGNTMGFGGYGAAAANFTQFNGSNIAAGLTMDYWVNPAEQIRLENYFRWYYGRKF